jgi:hypothetical protein
MVTGMNDVDYVWDREERARDEEGRKTYLVHEECFPGKTGREITADGDAVAPAYLVEKRHRQPWAKQQNQSPTLGGW